MSNVEPPQYVSYTKAWHSSPYAAISPSRPDLSMTGKNIVITGGGSGIGKGSAIAFAQAGARSVSIVGRRRDRLETSSEAIKAAAPGEIQVSFEVADMTVPEQAEKAFARIAEQVGNIDILINNAGAIAPPGPAATAPLEQLTAVMNANVVTTFNATHSFLKHSGFHPVLVNITAGLVHIRPMPMMGLYTAAKAAQTKLIDYMAAENPQLHVVHLHPGMVTTEIGGPDSNIEGPDKGKSQRPVPQLKKKC
jgi:NAD(P)-dependent dehydrogenase (short-subunit alcohol dehydrogenase family)